MPQNGPTSILISRLHRLGWHVTPSGLIRDRWNDFDLFTESIDALKLRIAVPGRGFLRLKSITVLTFEGLQCVDLAATAALVESFSSSDQVFFRCTLMERLSLKKMLGNGMKLRMGAARFVKVLTVTIIVLGNVLFFASARGHLTPEFWNWLSRMPRCVSEHAWMIRPVSFDHLAQCLLSLPEPDIRDARLSCCVGPVVDLLLMGPVVTPIITFCDLLLGLSQLHNQH